MFIYKRVMFVVDVDFVFFYQKFYVFDCLGYYFIFVVDYLWYIDFEVFEFNVVLFKFFFGIVVVFRGVEQGFGRDIFYIEVGVIEVVVVFDDSCFFF